MTLTGRLNWPCLSLRAGARLVCHGLTSTEPLEPTVLSQETLLWEKRRQKISAVVAFETLFVRGIFSITVYAQTSFEHEFRVRDRQPKERRPVRIVVLHNA